MMRRDVRIGLGAVVLLGMACSSPVEPGGALTATLAGETLVLENPGVRPAYFFAIDQDMAALANWAPCEDPATCPSVPGRSTIRIPVANVAGYHAGTDVILVYWWHLVRGTTGFSVDEIRCAGAAR